MKALLDTHTLLWWLDGDEQLSLTARSWIEIPEHRILVSAASAWEIATKVRIGKLPGAQAVAANFHECLISQGFAPLDITADHALRAGSLPGPHRDPFDRMLIAQAQALNIPLISNENLFDHYGVRRIW
ncbi:MAG: type II toxin-antitoxin system VapC family toxin [Nitrosomonas sp.]|nr:MAG: type II toxin-antitoxin system VapC family toxin [Nitrosomonas sp.]